MRYTLVTIPPPEMVPMPGIHGTEMRHKRVQIETPVNGKKVYSEGPVELWEDPLNGVAADDPAVSVYVQKYRDTLTEALWRAAMDWQERYISGVAIGLLTLGVAQQKPKALAVMQWNGDHWSEYYRRKEVCLNTGELDCDFSSSGPMPFSVPELREELGI